MLKIRKLVSWRLHLALAARSIDAVALQELANACQAMVALPNLMKAEIKTESEEKPLPALVLGLVRVLMLFLSDDDDEWDIPNTRWCEATRFLRCGVGVTRRMQKIADAAAGAARAWMSPSGRFAAPGVAASTPYLRESVLGTGLMDAYAGDLNFRVETFERIPRGWRAAVAIFKWTTAFCAITRLQHLLEPSRTGTDPFLVVHHTLSKREAQHEITERRDAAHNDEVRARRFVPTELVQARNYPFHRPRPLLLVVANDVPPKARMVILEKLQAALPGLFLTITRPIATRDDTTQTFDSTKIRDALALGHCVILESDVGLRDVTQRAFVSSFAAVKHGLHPTPMCVLLRGNIKNRSDLFGPEQGSDIEEKVYREGIERRMVDADIKVALDRTTRLRLELAEDAITREMVEQAKTGDGVPTPSPALVIVMEAVIVLLTPGKVYEGPSQGDIATSAVSWRLSRRLLAQPSFLRAKLQQVDVTTIPSINLVALERYLHHSLWPNAIVSRSQVVSNRLLYALAVWVESATKAARLIASDGTGTLAPEITRFGPVSGLFERVVVFDNCPIDHNQVGAGENLAVMQLMDAVLADVRVYRTANVLVRSNMNASSKSRKQKTIDEERCVVTLFHECRRIFACVYSPSSGQRWITVISEDDIDHLLTPTAMPCGGESLADKLPPKTHTEMYARLARLCLLQKRRIEDCPETIEPPSPYELVLRPRSIRLYRHVLQLGGYLVTVTIAEQSRGHVQVDAFVHSSNSQSSFAEAVTLTLAVELENILGRLSAAQARSVFVPASRIPSIVLDRLRLYCAMRTRMLEPEFQPKLMPSMRLNVRTGENASGRLLLRRAVRVSRNNGVTPGERLVFTLFECHEDGNFLATFYSPRSSTRHTIRLSSSAAEELLHVSRHAPPSRLHQLLVRTFSIAYPAPKDNEHDSEGSDANINRTSEEEADTRICYRLDSEGSDANINQTSEEEADTRICYRLRRRILARFPCALLVMEDPHQRVTKKQVKRAYVQVELCDQEPEGEHNIQTATGKENTNTVRYRVTLAESCLEQTLLLQECEIEASIPVEYSWSRASCSDRKSFSRDIVRRYFQWDPNGGSGENGSVVAHLPCGSFWATEVKTTSMLGNSARNHIDQAAKEEQAGYITRPRTKQTITDSEVSVVSCTYLLDDRDTESDDELEEDDFKGIKRRTYSYDTDELIHRGSYHANGLYVVIRVSMRAFFETCSLFSCRQLIVSENAIPSRSHFTCIILLQVARLSLKFMDVVTCERLLGPTNHTLLPLRLWTV
ncbi:LOW QUALITY PROTEIN: hypothetical protein PHMEG_00019328 [Phytophthora megakarya]|uniref:Uncharacterized protein n=1 Tax=Phytophthora megakarya TaxID=4795 RepID=A0A225VSN8_9STRA|nr:LOW QUALITY PROTEIN: hypothetical protein PHMEG_00019328 [Phytophthora megakarya]